MTTSRSDPTTLITSAQNPRVKDLLRLSKSHFRRKASRFLIEGDEELEHFWRGGWQALSILLCPELCPQTSQATWQERARQRGIRLENFSTNAFRRFSYRDEPAGLILEAELPKHAIETFEPGNDFAPVFVLDRIEKPGNVGALLRTAAAVGSAAVLCAGSAPDAGNPNLIRSSRGHIFRVPFFSGTDEEVFEWLHKNGYSLLGADAGGQQLLGSVSYGKRPAIVLGTEDLGLSPFWRKACNHLVRIPMAPGMDSLNVSVSGALLLYDAWRSFSNFTLQPNSA